MVHGTWQITHDTWYMATTRVATTMIRSVTVTIVVAILVVAILFSIMHPQGKAGLPPDMTHIYVSYYLAGSCFRNIFCFCPVPPFPFFAGNGRAKKKVVLSYALSPPGLATPVMCQPCLPSCARAVPRR